jgi:hypothetical protein
LNAVKLRPDTVHSSRPSVIVHPMILAHPDFAKAQTVFIEAILDLYEHDPFLNRLLLEAGRHVIFSVMCFEANYNEADRATWST